MLQYGKGESVIPQFSAIDIQKGELAILKSEKGLLITYDEEIPRVNPDILFERLSYTHFTKLMYMDDLQRTFYEYEAIRGTWSIKEEGQRSGTSARNPVKSTSIGQYSSLP